MANGDVVETTDHPELLWAVRGAGQFFGGGSFRVKSSYLVRAHCTLSSQKAFPSHYP